MLHYIFWCFRGFFHVKPQTDLDLLFHVGVLELSFLCHVTGRQLPQTHPNLSFGLIPQSTSMHMTFYWKSDSVLSQLYFIPTRYSGSQPGIGQNRHLH